MTSDVRAALDAGDDGFHEIQLNGKQLVFLGMATTLVSVVIFLCGVLVGRGVKPLDTVAQAAGPQAFDAAAATSVGRAGRDRHAGPGAGAAGVRADRRRHGPRRCRGRRHRRHRADAARRRSRPAPADTDAAASAASGPSRPRSSRRPPRRSSRARPPSRSRPRPRRRAVPPAVRPAPAPPVVAPKPTPPPAPTAVATTAPATAGGKIAVQVGAFKTRSEADALAKRLSGRGYAVYVMAPDQRRQERLPRPRRQLRQRRRSAADQRPADVAGEAEALDYALAALSGALFALSFPRFGHPALGWVALVPLLIVLGRPARLRAPAGPPRPHHRRRRLQRHALLADRRDDHVRRPRLPASPPAVALLLIVYLVALSGAGRAHRGARRARRSGRARSGPRRSSGRRASGRAATS